MYSCWCAASEMVAGTLSWHLVCSKYKVDNGGAVGEQDVRTNWKW